MQHFLNIYDVPLPKKLYKSSMCATVLVYYAYNKIHVKYTLVNACVHAKSLQSCPTLCDLMDYSPPGSFVHGILQARILEWVATPFATPSQPQGSNTGILCLMYWQAGSLPLVPPGKSHICKYSL